MQLPKLTGNNDQAQYGYSLEDEQDSKKRMLLMIGGAILVIVLLVLVLLGGGSKPGKQNMHDSLKSTSQALGIIDEYETKLQSTPTKNDVALTQILLRGNYQKLNTLYIKTYKASKDLSNNPKADAASITALNRSERNNTLDTDIITVLQAKIQSAQSKLVLVQPAFKNAVDKKSIQDSIADMQSVEDALNRAR